MLLAPAPKTGWRAPVIMGLVFGLALASKLNAPFALIGCGLYWLTQNLWTATKQSDGLRLPVVPLWMIVVPSVGFAVQIAAGLICGRTPSAATAPMSAFTPNITPSTSSMRGRSGIARSPHGTRRSSSRAALPRSPWSAVWSA